MLRVFLTLFCILLAAEIGFAQTNSWVITIATGDTLSGCALTSLDGDSLFVVWSGFPISLPVESIRNLQFHRKSDFWKGALYGSAAGAIGSTLVAASSSGAFASSGESGAMGALGGFFIGGLTAEYLSRDDWYDLTRSDVAEKRSVIRALLSRSEALAGSEKPK